MVVQAGWYNDGTGDARLRWWDGQSWTDAYADVAAPPPPIAVSPSPSYGAATAATPVAVAPTQAEAPAPARKLPKWARFAIAGGALLIIIGAVVVASVVALISRPSPEDVTLEFLDAYVGTDCDAAWARTSERIREEAEWTSCEAFEASAASDFDLASDFSATVTSLDTTDDAVIVTTSEAYLWDGEPEVDVYRYTLVLQDGSWIIDSWEWIEP